MKDKNLAALVARLTIIARRLTSADLSGDFSSAFKGSGLEFAHIRTYESGDEVRSIDWKSSAKMNRIMVKEYIQERERTVMIVLDISASLNAGSQEELKNASARTVAACLALMAQNTNDKVGVLLFADTVKAYMPPRKGASYNAQLVHELLGALNTKDKTGPTNVEAALNHLAALHIRNAIIFIVSDWIHDNETNGALLSYVGKKNETVAVRIIDPRERELPPLGLIPLEDPETGTVALVRTSTLKKNELTFLLGKRLHDQKQLLKKHSIAVLDIEIGNSLVTTLATFFHSRAH